METEDICGHREDTNSSTEGEVICKYREGLVIYNSMEVLHILVGDTCKRKEDLNSNREGEEVICTYREVAGVTCKHKEAAAIYNNKVVVEDTCSHGKEANSSREGKNMVVLSSRE